jgi:signal transduction histidine kinase/CheY-like chemotaxis protein/HAMP domain-containing protein
LAGILDYIRHSIKGKITTMMIASLLFILIGAIVVPWSMIQILQNYDSKSRQLSESHKHITDIVNHTNETIMRVRGYFAYLDNYEYEQIFSSKKELDKALAAIKSTPLTEEESNLVQRVEAFFEQYLTTVLSKGSEYAKQGDHESLRQLAAVGSNNPINDLFLYAKESEKKVGLQQENERAKMVKNMLLQATYFIVYFILVLIISLFIMRRLARGIGNPLRRLSHYALNYSKGDTIELDIQNRKDEIGVLAKSLFSMIHEIIEKEEELLAQNEELQAQQEELEAQQEELQQAFDKLQENEMYLNKRNLLTQSLTNTLDKEVLLESIIRNVVEITQSDKGILLLMTESEDYAAYGISQAEALQFVNGFGQSAINRSLYGKQLYVREREATIGERGYLSEAVLAYDIFIPLYKGNGAIAACMVLTRVGKAIAAIDEQEITGLAGQISLSLEKLEMFEAIEGQRQMNKDMLNTIQEGVQLLNLNGKSLQVNQRLYELMELSYEQAQLNGVSIQDFKALLGSKIEEPESFFKFIERALSGDMEQDQNMNYVLKGQESRVIHIYWEPIYRNKQKFGLLLVHRDITKEHEVDRMKSEFVSTVSHELRTPLSSILGFSELLLHRELKPERQQKYMKTIHQEAKRLTQLVNDFLDLQRIENGMQFYDLKPIEMIPLLEEVMELQQAGTANHTLIWGAGQKQVTVLGDHDKLFQVMVNLINNAIKYSPAGGVISISSRQDGNRVWVDITDEGLGIPEQALSSLFTKFYRVDNSDRREIGGTGLGLAIVKEVVNRHQGDVSVKSRLGVGSTFSFYLPIHQGPAVGSDGLQSTQRTANTASIHVMLVENDHNLSTMLQDELMEKGYRTTVFSDGISAINAMEEQQPDIIVLDLKLASEMSGWEVIERMKTSDGLVDIPIIISSAFEEKEKAMQWGISHFLIKPYAPIKLIEAIEEICPSRHS